MRALLGFALSFGLAFLNSATALHAAQPRVPQLTSNLVGAVAIAAAPDTNPRVEFISLHRRGAGMPVKRDNASGADTDADTDAGVHNSAAPDKAETSAPKAAEDGDVPPREPDPRSVPVVSHEELCNVLLESARQYDLPIEFFANLIWQESRFRHDAVSPVGAQGVAQFMPKVAQASRVENPFDPLQAIPASARLLRDLTQQFGNLGFAAAAYNAGPQRVSDWLGNRRTLPIETRKYVSVITGRSIEQWRSLDAVEVEFTMAPRLPCRRMPAYAALDIADKATPETVQPDPPPQPKKKDAKDTEARQQRADGKVAKKRPARSAKARGAIPAELRIANLEAPRKVGRHGHASAALSRSESRSRSLKRAAAVRPHGKKHIRKVRAEPGPKAKTVRLAGGVK
jgi:soluble lytic murein transglycosylase-like protein